MTNLPKLGEKYYRKALGCDWMVVVEKIENGKIICSIVQGNGEEFNRFTYLPELFWEDYRELTEQEKQLIDNGSGLWELIKEKKRIRENEFELIEVRKHVSYLNESIKDRQQELEQYKIRQRELESKISGFYKPL